MMNFGDVILRTLFPSFMAIQACTGIPPGQSPATAPSHFFYIAVRSQEHTRPHEWRTPFAYRLVLLPYSGVMQHILRVRAGTPPMPSARPGAWGSAPSP